MNDWVPFSAVAIFAEDVREERAGTISLIGILPDNVVLSDFPAVLARLTLYIRISYDPGDPPGTVSCGLRVNDDAPLMTQDFAADALARAVAENAASGAKIGTIIARFGAVNVALREPCLLNATVTWNDEEFVIGNLMVKAPTV